MEKEKNDSFDLQMMRRCIDLAKTARSVREFPFACVIAREGEIIVETINEVARDRDVTRHAELVAVSKAQLRLGTTRLSGCALYTTVEPCPMCSIAIRASRISRVVYALGSPLMGGSSKWDVLGDREISNTLPEYFGRQPPKIVAGILADEAAAVWHQAHPLVWAIIKRRGCFVVPEVVSTSQMEQAGHRSLLQRLLAKFQT